MQVIGLRLHVSRMSSAQIERQQYKDSRADQFARRAPALISDSVPDAVDVPVHLLPTATRGGAVARSVYDQDRTEI
jgi:hypothetical protein